MRKMILRLAIGVLAFCVGIAAAFWFVNQDMRRGVSEVRADEVQPVAPDTILSADLLFDERDETDKLKKAVDEFTYIGGMNALTNLGCFNIKSYRATDDSRLALEFVNMPSPKQATKELRRRIKDAKRVIEREPIINNAGKRIGEVVIVELEKENSNSMGVASFGLFGSELHSRYGSSVEIVKRFTKQVAP